MSECKVKSSSGEYSPVDKEIFFDSLFEKCDKNNDEVVEIHEMTKDPNVTIEISGNEFNRYDTNNDGKLDYNEFTEMVLRCKRAFSRYVYDYVSLFIIYDGDQKEVVVRRRRSITGRYENKAKFDKSTLGLLILSTLQIVLYFANTKEYLKFKHDRRYEVWRYFSYVLAHNSTTHLLINVFVQIFFGVPLEMIHNFRVLIIYSAGTLGGGLLHSICDPQEDMLGASPAVYAVLTAHISKVILNFREVSNPIVQLLIFGLFTALDTVYNYFMYSNQGNVSYISHLGGAACGLLVGILVLKNLRENRWEKIVWYFSAVLYVLTMVTLIFLEIFLGPERHKKTLA